LATTQEFITPGGEQPGLQRAMLDKVAVVGLVWMWTSIKGGLWRLGTPESGKYFYTILHREKKEEFFSESNTQNVIHHT